MTAVFTFAWISMFAVSFAVGTYLPDRVTVFDGESFSYRNGLLTVSTDIGKVAEASVSTGDSVEGRLKLFGLIPLKNVRVTSVEELSLVASGEPFGIKLFSQGVMAVGFGDIYAPSGTCCPAKEAGIEEGDIIITVDGKIVSGNDELSSIVSASEGRPLEVVYRRDNVEIATHVVPVSDSGGYKIGMWVRDSSAGIGTLTYIDPSDGSVAGLGHGISDVDTGVIYPVSSGEFVDVVITDVRKGSIGLPGELRGMFVTDAPFATLDYNCETGIYGKLLTDCDDLTMPVGLKQEIHTGKAKILTTVDGSEPEYCDVEIEQINLSDRSMTKNMVIRVTDTDLISKTGGIVQGMSGSPIVQDGKIIGAVTHVFVNEPEKGYGIFIENMLLNDRTKQKSAA